MRESKAPAGLETKAVEIYEEEERRIESEKPHLLYRRVLSKTALAVAGRIGWDLKPGDSNFLAASLPNWLPFKDTNPALERLARDHKLGILSNVDNDLLAGTLKCFPVEFEIVVTAENVRSYKPAFAHFEAAHQLIGDQSWIHVAASQYHDIEPAATLGISAVWVNRKAGALDHRYSKDQVSEVTDLSQLVHLLDS